MRGGVLQGVNTSVQKTALPSSFPSHPQGSQPLERGIKSASLLQNPVQPELLWSQSTLGLAYSLSIATQEATEKKFLAQGPFEGRILISSVSDPEKISTPPTQKPPPQLSFFNLQGHLLWSLPMTFPVKSQALSQDGSLIVVSTPIDTLVGIDALGKILWNVKANCKPILLEKTKKILCVHDDDTVPEIIFDVFDWAGKKTISYKRPEDFIAAKISSSEDFIVIALSAGKVLLFDAQLKLLWEKVFEGEVIDVAISSTSLPWIGVMTRPLAHLQNQISLLSSKGETVRSVFTTRQVLQIELDPDGTALVHYENNQQGQRMTALSIPQLSPIWTHGNPVQAPFSSNVLLKKKFVSLPLNEKNQNLTLTGAITSFENFGFLRPGLKKQSDPKTEILALQLDGKPLWEITLPFKLGTYCYRFALDLLSEFLGVIKDDGSLSLYRLHQTR